MNIFSVVYQFKKISLKSIAQTKAMIKKKQIFIPVVIVLGLTLSLIFYKVEKKRLSGAPPYGEAETAIPSLTPWQKLQKYWQRPDGPPKIGLQIGHLDNQQLPNELEKLRKNGGASAGGYTEAEVNQAIAEQTAEILKEKGVAVDILPATVPPGYWADAFIAIHADGSLDPYASGFKIAGPWRDLTSRSNKLVNLLEENYQTATQLNKDPNISRNMRGYYAFAWWRYEHSIHPMTTAAIVETGFLTNWGDRQLITQTPEIPAQGLAKGIIKYLKSEALL
jgi:N-acetylmuramoyl-L-alanine amidase